MAFDEDNDVMWVSDRTGRVIAVPLSGGEPQVTETGGDSNPKGIAVLVGSAWVALTGVGQVLGWAPVRRCHGCDQSECHECCKCRGETSGAQPPSTPSIHPWTFPPLALRIALVHPGWSRGGRSFGYG